MKWEDLRIDAEMHQGVKKYFIKERIYILGFIPIWRYRRDYIPALGKKIKISFYNLDIAATYLSLIVGKAKKNKN
jgi:hypothetical protein